MRNFILVLTLLSLVFAEKTTTKIPAKAIDDFAAFCKTEKFDFCSKDYMNVAMSFLNKQFNQLSRNFQKEKEEAKKAEKMRRKSRLREKMILQNFRQHFLDRHI